MIRNVHFTVAGFMLIVALLAVDFGVLAALRTEPSLSVRIAYFGALPTANLAAACLALAIARLVHRGEVSLALVTLGLVGGAAILLLLGVASLAPSMLHEYLDLTVGFYRGPRQYEIELHRFGLVGTGWPALLIVYAAMTPPLLLPALVGAWMTRGYRLRLVTPPQEDAPERG
ncbi:hypothetical protein [Paludisphaera soli]|uniref:hypothetical protein n=1 Tax=Paludisphaera soli TaxID=2712865 RepID=UPI0013EB3C34|nr:hypothetical protein [Paludisphaera soli]